MGIDFNAEFTRLNTNNTGDSANKLDSEECRDVKMSGAAWTVWDGITAEEFKEANQHCSEYDTNKDGVVTVSEQKASIADQLKNVFSGCVARFFNGDITYNDSDPNSAPFVTQKVKNRIQNALNYIQYAKDNNVDIFTDNTGTGVDDVDGEQIEYTDADGIKRTGYENLRKIKTKRENADGTITSTCEDGSTYTKNADGLCLSGTGEQDGISYQYKNSYSENGSFVQEATYSDGDYRKAAFGQNKQLLGRYFVTKNGNYKVQAQEGDDFFTTLKKLGITKTEDIRAVIKANPMAMANKKFRTDVPDVYIPKEVIANMKANGTYDEDKLIGKKLDIGNITLGTFGV